MGPLDGRQQRPQLGLTLDSSDRWTVTTLQAKRHAAGSGQQRATLKPSPLELEMDTLVSLETATCRRLHLLRTPKASMTWLRYPFSATASNLTNLDARGILIT